MNLKQFDKIVTDQLSRSELVLMGKGTEYAEEATDETEVDRLAHFKKAAALQDMTTAQAAFGMLSKHLVSVADTTSVSVTEVKQYTVTLTYFAATIAVTYPSGSTCTCSNGTTTLTAPNTTGSYTFTVPSAGTWTVKSTNGTDTARQAVSITANGQSTSVTLSYKPTASTSQKPGVNYTPGISGLTAEKMSLYGEAISRNSAITNTTSTVYIDDGASHYKISVGDSINIAINGTSYAFKIMGFNHDTLTTSTAYGSATATGKAGMESYRRPCRRVAGLVSAARRA